MATVANDAKLQDLIEWDDQSHPNECHYILRSDGFHISFLQAHSALTVTRHGTETALVRGSGASRESFVLGADLRAEYEAAVGQGWDACLAVYERNKPSFRGWSTRDGYSYPEDGAPGGGHCE